MQERSFFEERANSLLHAFLSFAVKHCFAPVASKMIVELSFVANFLDDKCHNFRFRSMWKDYVGFAGIITKVFARGNGLLFSWISINSIFHFIFMHFLLVAASLNTYWYIDGAAVFCMLATLC